MKKRTIIRILESVLTVLLAALCIAAPANAALIRDPAYMKRIEEIQRKTLIELNAGQQAAVDAMPEQLRALTYALLGGDGVAYLRLAQGFYAEDIEFYYTMDAAAVRDQLLGLLNQLQYGESDNEVQLALRMYTLAAKRYCFLEKTGEGWSIRSYEQTRGYDKPISELSPYELRDEIAKNTADADYKAVQETWYTYLSENDRRAKIEELRTLPYLAPSAGQRDLMDAAVKAIGARTSREAAEVATYAIATGTDGFAYLREALGYTPEALAPFYGLGNRFESELREAYASGAYDETMLARISAAYLKNYGVLLKDGAVAGYAFDFPNIGLTEHPKAETSQNGLQELIDAWERYNTGYRNIDNLAAELGTMALPPLNEQQLSLLNAVSDIFKPVIYGYLASGAMDSASAARQFDDYDTAKLYGWAYLVQVMGYDAERVARFTEYEFNYFSDLYAMIDARNHNAVTSEKILLQASACVREGTPLQFVKIPGTENYRSNYRYAVKKTDRPIIKMSVNECLQFNARARSKQPNKSGAVATPPELVDLIEAYLIYLEKRDGVDSEWGRRAESTAAAEVPAPTISGSYTPKLLNVPSLRTAGRTSALLRGTSEVYWSVLYKVYVDENAGIDVFYRGALTGRLLDFFEQEYAKPERELRTDYMRLYAKREQQNGYLTNMETDQLELLRSLLIWQQYEKYGRLVTVRCDSVKNLLMYENKYDAALAASPEELLALIENAKAAGDVYGQEYCDMLTALRTFKATDPRRREDGGSWFGLPAAMSDAVLNIVKHTNDYQRVYAYLCADGTLMEKYDSGIWDYRYWTWMPQQLVKQKEMSDYLKGMPAFLTENMGRSMLSDGEERMIADILALYGAAPYFNAKEPTFFSDFSGIYGVTFSWGSRSSDELYGYWDLDKGADICLEAGAVYCQALLNPNGGGTNGLPHFVSSRGEYHYPLAHRSADELYEYYAEMEQKYKDATDPGDEQELKEWLELINAWIALRREHSLNSAGEEVAAEGEIVYTGLSDAKAHTYLLEISTGAAAGAKVEYLKVLYTAADGARRTAYVFPQTDSLKNSYKTAAEVGTGRATARWVADNLGYQAGDGTNRKGLQSFKTDQYLISLYGEVASIDEVQAFARQDKTSAGGNNWTLYGVNLYAVDGVRGVERYGYYSSDVYIDFDGTLAARVAFDGDVTYPGEGAGGSDRVVLGNYHNLNWSGSDTLFRFGGAFTTFGYELQTAGFGNGGKRSGTQADSNVIIKVDFADKYLAGLECLSTGYTGDKTLGGAGNICEALALQIRYIDTAGGTRQATLPVTTSVAAWLVNSRTLDVKQSYAGIAQQGESIAFPCALPDFSEMVSITVINGATSAAKAAGLTAVKDFKGAAERDKRVEQSDSDRVAITGIAIYKAPESALSANTEDGFPRFSVAGSPVQYYVSANDEGTGIPAGGSITMISDAYADRSHGTEQAGQYLRNYAQGSRLKAYNREEKYLVTLYTDDIEHAGTSSDVMLRFRYIDLDGAEQETPLFNAREYANEFYGYWPASQSDFGYRTGMSVAANAGGGWRGGELSFIIPVQNVQTFTGASLRLTGEDARGHVDDEWQMKDLSIRTVEDVGTRVLRWESVSNTGGTSDRSFARAVAGREIFRLSTMGASSGSGTTRDPNDPNGGTDISGGGSTGGSGGGNYTGSMLFQNSDFFTWDINVPSEVERSSVDWNRLKYNMSYAEAVQDLAFRRTRGTYTVDVNVASDANNYGSDDCGSKNQFYFQLVFEDGCSGVVLANQALEADGFRAGTTERFTIATTKDFGELQSIRIIPEDMSSDSDKYDKLKIDSIYVRRATTGQTSPLWKIMDVGWIGIDYRDEGAAETLGGAAKRSMEEIAHTYPVSESTVSVNVQISVTTAPYVAEDGGTLPQFRGELSAVLRYRDTGGITRKVQLDDVVRLMYEFNNQTPRYAETVSRMDGATAIGNAISDPAYMFRANRTDRFEVGLDGLDRILSITFQPTAESGVQTKWNVSDVSVYLIHGNGRRMLNAQGEYYMSYQDDEQLEMVAWDTSTTSPKHTADLFVTGSKTKGFEVEFGASKITLNAETARASQLSELPLSDNDTLNVVLFPDEKNNDWAAELYDMKLIAQYSMAGRDALMQASVRQMNHAVLEDGTKAFVWEGLNVNGLNALYSLSAKADRDGACAISGGYAQLVRGGFVYQTYSLGYAANLDLGMDIPLAAYTGERQEVRLQFGADMAEQRLTTGKNDVAVSFTYRTDGPIDREYQSPRILLSKQGFNVLKPGEIISLSFAQGRVREITGMTVQTVGSTSVSVEGAFAADIVTNAKGDTVNGRWSFLPGAGERGSMIGMYRAEDADGRGKVDVLTLTFTTAAGQENKGGGMNAAVAMTIGYYDGYGAMQTRTIADIRPYIQNGSAFLANTTTTVRMMVSDVADLRYVELTPAHEANGATAWNLTRVTAKFGDDGHELERIVTPPLEADVTYHYNLASILVGASVERGVTQAGEDGALHTVTMTEETKDGALSVLIASGESIRVTPRLTGSTEGMNVTLYGLNAASGAMGSARLDDTRGYTAEYIAERIKNAPSAEEAAVWRAVTPQTGSFEANPDGSYTFLPPRNYTGSAVSYRIVITSVESRDASATVDVTVESEAEDPVAKQVAEVRARKELEAQQELQRRQEELEQRLNG